MTNINELMESMTDDELAALHRKVGGKYAERTGGASKYDEVDFGTVSDADFAALKSRIFREAKVQGHKQRVRAEAEAIVAEVEKNGG